MTGTRASDQASLFSLGVILIGISAVFILLSKRNLGNWIMAVGAGGSVIAVALLERSYLKPRENIRGSVKDILKHYILFLGYLRRLYRIDQVYARCIIEEERRNPQEIDTFSKMTRDVVSDAIRYLYADQGQ